MSKMTCGELTKLGFQDFAGITMWLSGCRFDVYFAQGELQLSAA